jgi:ubiquinone biosynthesis protein UbiJ
MEAFHGRLAGIKHNVDELNHKLDDLENKNWVLFGVIFEPFIF